jgi:pyruvate dehydrogenase E2 component (dihydrolipoamide acetyltransferase)
VSPSARRRARELGVDVSALQGSGPGGRIVHRDIERAAEELEAALQRSAAAAPIDRRPALAQPSLPAAAASDNGVTLTAMRRTIARRMLQSVQTIPQFPLTYRIDMTNMLRIKQLIQGSLLRKQIKLSLTDFMIKAVAETLLNHKALNASFVGDPLEENCRIVEHSHVNAGLAVAVEGGLMVPVIHEAERLSIAEIAAVRMARIEALRSKSYAVSELQGGTFTLSNLGSFGAEQFQAIVNPPESFILAVGTVQDEVVAHEGRMEIRPIMRMTGTFDHRLIDGAPAAAFMQELAGRLESEDWQLI